MMLLCSVGGDSDFEAGLELLVEPDEQGANAWLQDAAHLHGAALGDLDKVPWFERHGGLGHERAVATHLDLLSEGSELVEGVEVLLK